MLTDPTLLRIQKLYNAHEREILRMLDLCYDDPKIVEEVYFRCKLIYYNFYLPTDSWEIFQLYNHGLQVKHKETGQLGHINYFYKYVTHKGQTNYGVQWDSGKDCKYKLTFWQPRHKFDII